MTMSEDQQGRGDQVTGVNMLAVIVAVRRRWWLVVVVTVLSVLISIPVGDVVDGESQDVHIAIDLGQVPWRMSERGTPHWELAPVIAQQDDTLSAIDWVMELSFAEFNRNRIERGEKVWRKLRWQASFAGPGLFKITSEVPVQDGQDAVDLMSDAANLFIATLKLAEEQQLAIIDGDIVRMQQALDLLDAESRLQAEAAEILQRQRQAEASQAKLKDEVLIARARAELEQAKIEAEATLKNHEAALVAARVSRETLLLSQEMLKGRIDQLDTLLADSKASTATLMEYSRTAETSAAAELLVLAMASLDDRHSRWIGERYQVLTELTVELPVTLATLDIRIATLNQEIEAQRVICSATEHQLLAEPVVRRFDVREAELGARTAEVLGSGVVASIAMENESTRKQLLELVELRRLSTPVSVVGSGAFLGTISRPIPIVVIWVLAALVGCLIGINVVVFSAILSSADERASFG